MTLSSEPEPASALEAEIRRIIATEGPITVARYMALCLGHPTLGYYMTRDPFGARGDFITAPEVSQMFGELIGVWAALVWRSMNRPSPLFLVELGPGRGTLMADLLRAAAIVPSFASALQVHLVETSPVLRRRQQEMLAGLAVPIAWHDDIAQVPEGPIIAVANEFFDALPVHQAVKGTHGWHERVIGIGADGRLAYGVRAELVRGLEGMLPPHVRAAPPGSLFEWRSDRIASLLSRRVATFGGAALIIDYGHAESTVGETLQAVGKHGYADPLATPGEVDLTAHVDFAALARPAERAGCRVEGPIPQRVLLQRLGIEARAAALAARATPAQAEAVGAALRRLTDPSPTGMGELFKAVAFAHPTLPPLPGFR